MYIYIFISQPAFGISAHHQLCCSSAGCRKVNLFPVAGCTKVRLRLQRRFAPEQHQALSENGVCDK